MKIPSRSRRLIIALVILLIFGSAAYWLKKNKPEAIKEPVTDKSWTVRTQMAHLSAHPLIVPLYGQIISQSQIDITSAIQADVLQRHVNTGDRVNKGQLLISLDETDFQLLIDQRSAELSEIKAVIEDENRRYKTDKAILKKEKGLLKLAENAVIRAKALEKREMASSSQLEEARRNELTQNIAITQRQSAIDNHPARLAQLNARLKQTAARLNQAKENLLKTRIISPVNGYVTNILVDQAENVRQGSELVRLFDSENIEIRALLPTRHIQNIQQLLAEGKKLTGVVKTSNQTYSLQLDRTTANIDQGLSSNYAYFKFREPVNDLLIGQTVSLELVFPPVPDSLALPHDALYGTEYLFKVVDNHLERINVQWLGETYPQKKSASTKDKRKTPPLMIEPDADEKKPVEQSTGDIALLRTEKTLLVVKSQALKNGDIIVTSKFANAMSGLKVAIDTAKNNSSSAK